MIIKNVIIRNFRGFEEYEIKLASKTTVLIGKNGSGKTNLIIAIKKALSFVFATNAKIKGNQIASSGDLHIEKFDKFDARFDERNRLFLYPINIQVFSEFNSELLNWSLYKEKEGGSLFGSKYKDAFEKIHNYYNQDLEKSNLPVFAYFSDSYPHKKSPYTNYAKQILKKGGKLPRNFAYYQWNAESNCAEIWQQRYINVKFNHLQSTISKIHRINSLKLFKENDPTSDNYNVWDLELRDLEHKLEFDNKDSFDFREVQFIENKIKLFTKPIREELNFINSNFEVVSVDINSQGKRDFDISFEFKDGRQMFFETLPQGYNRLLSIVFDIAYRSFVLNKESESKGVVIIDEVELHLHPSLQQEVLERFRITFPKMQFVVSIHSPLVISNLNSEIGNKVLSLNFDGNNYVNEEIPNIYGINYNVSLTDIMGSSQRISEIDYLIDTYILLKRRKMEVESEEILDKIYSIVGKDNLKISKEIESRLE